MGWQIPFCANEQELAGGERWALGGPGIHQAAAQSKWWQRENVGSEASELKF